MDQNKIKKMLLSLMLIPLVWFVAACTNNQNETDTNNEAAETSETTEEVNEEATEEESTDHTIQITDSLGHDITIEGPVETVVTEQPSHAEIIYSLGKEEAIIGRGSYVDYPSEVLDITDVGSGQDLNFEEIIQLDPDVVFIGLMGDPDSQFSQLEDAGITVVAVHAETLEGVYDTTNLIGQILGVEEEAKNVVNDMQSTFEEYEALADEQEAENLSVYYEISPLEFGLWTAGSDTFMDELGDILNLDNVFEDVDGFGEISEEQVLDRNPEYIVTTSMESEDFNPVDEIINRSGWENVAAVENENVFMADSDQFTRPGPRLTDAIESFYNFVYGEE